MPTELDEARLGLRRRLAANLKEERKRARITQERAAELAGFSLQYVQRIERCLVNVPLDTIARLGLALRVDPARLLAPLL